MKLLLRISWELMPMGSCLIFYLFIYLLKMFFYIGVAFLPGEFQGWRSLVGCDPWGHKEPDVTEWLTHTELFNSVMLVSGVQQRASGGHIHVSILFQILFPFRLLQSIAQSSLCHTHRSLLVIYFK